MGGREHDAIDTGTNNIGILCDDLTGDRIDRRTNLRPGRWFNCGEFGTLPHNLRVVHEHDEVRGVRHDSVLYK